MIKGEGDGLGEVAVSVSVGVSVDDGTVVSDAMGTTVGADGVLVAAPAQAVRISAKSNDERVSFILMLR